MEQIEVLTQIYNFLNSLTGAGWEQTNKLVSWFICIWVVVAILRSTGRLISPPKK